MMRGMARRTIEIVTGHKLMAAVFLLLVVIRLPLAGYSHEFVLLAQDFNPTNFALYYLNNDLPAADDVEVGENKRTFVFSTAYFYMQLVFYKLGVPFEFFNKLHIVLGYPLLLLSLYFLAYAILKDKIFAVFAALFFYQNMWIFDMNIGYPILFNYNIYIGDLDHIPAVLMMAFLISGRFTAAGASCMFLTLLNPTYGGNATIILFAYTVLGRNPLKRIKKMAPALGLALAGVAITFMMIHFSTPYHNPVPKDIHDFCIRIYGHITPHIYDPKIFLQKFLFMVCVMVFAMIFEKYIRKWLRTEENPAALRFTRVFTAILILNGFVLYCVLYAVNPSLFILLSPSKTVIFAVMMVSVYLALAFYILIRWSRWAYGILFFFCYMLLLTQNPGQWFFMPGKWPFLWKPDTKIAILLAIAVCLCIHTCIIKLKSENTKSTSYASVACVLLLLFLTAKDMSRAIINNPNIKYATAMYDLQMKMRGKLPGDALLTPYKIPGSSNIFGQFAQWPIRTYSRTGGLVYWTISKNAYFDSKEIMDREMRAYSSAGIDLWPKLMRESRRLVKENPFLYYFGITIKDGNIRYNETASWSMTKTIMLSLKNKVDGFGFNQYLNYVGEIGATHVVICRDPEHKGPAVKAIVENDYFAVVEIPKTYIHARGRSGVPIKRSLLFQVP